MKFSIYSVEDDVNISKIINKTLTNQGFIVKSFYDGKSFFDELNLNKPNMILLDIMLPDMNGNEILKKIRSNSLYDDVEIIIISANHMLMDKVEGLDLGADDYIEKPFDLLELISRVNSKFRRIKKSQTFTSGDLLLDLDKHYCEYKDERISLTIKEFDILEVLIKNRGSVVTREQLLSTIWNENDAYETRTIDMHVRSLRKKLSEDLITTVYGIGYRLN